MSKCANMFLIIYILSIFISDCPIEEATINEPITTCTRSIQICNDEGCYQSEECTSSISSPPNDECLLPPHPEHGQYNAPMGLKPGDIVPNITLTYTCDRGYSLRGKRSPACVNGTWLAELPTCTIPCKPLKSTSVDFKCYKQHSTLEISCDLPQDSNSHATATCKDSYYLKPPPKYLTCIEGSWDYMPYCIPECGKVAPEGETLIINGEEAKINEFPWHVGLYDKTSTPILQICGGSIFTPKLVLTAAHCVYKDLAGLYPASSFAVAAGKLYRHWNSPKDEEKYVQKIDVMKIEIPERYKGAINSFMADVAVLVLERSFVLSSFVRPVCIRLDSQDNLNGQFGRVAGWGLTAEEGHSSRILRTVRLPYVSFLDCYKNSPESFRPLITSDKICAGYTNGTALCKGDSGGGLVFSRQNSYQELYYLYGIVSTSPRNKALTSCSASAYTGFTNIMNHQKWLQDICLQEWGCDNGGCISLEQRCHGGNNYCLGRSDEVGFCSGIKLSTSKDMCVLPVYPHHGNYSATIGLRPGDAVSHTSLTYSCNEGYSLKGEGSPNCIRGTWVAEVPTCEKRIEENVGELSCGVIMPSTGAQFKMASHTIDGNVTKYNEFPWMVDLFRSHERQCALTDRGCWFYSCDGSLISSKVVLTTGDCAEISFKLKASAGNWNLNTFGAQQERLVSKTVFHPSFRLGTLSRRQYDVALLVVDSPYTSSDNIGFICLPPPNLNMTSASCKVASWSFMGSGADRQKHLKVVDANHMDHDQCEKTIMKNGNSSFILRDSFTCAYTLNEDNCRAKDGSPLMCLIENHYYVRGLLSWHVSCGNKTSTDVYTDVVKVRNWIDQEMRANGFNTEV